MRCTFRRWIGSGGGGGGGENGCHYDHKGSGRHEGMMAAGGRSGELEGEDG